MDFVFRRARYSGAPLDFVFGGDEGGGSDAPPASVGGTHVLPGLTRSGLVSYDNRNPRRVSVAPVALFQQGTPEHKDMSAPWDSSGKLTVEPLVPWDDSTPTVSETGIRWVNSTPLVRDAVTRWQKAIPIADARRFVHQVATPVRSQKTVAWQVGHKQAAISVVSHQVATEAPLTIVGMHAVGQKKQVLVIAGHAVGTAAGMQLLAPWQIGRRPPPGVSVREVVDPTLTPHVVSMDLVFCRPSYTGGPINIIFGRSCDVDPIDPGTIVVPIRSVYMTVNNFSLIRLDNGYPIHATAASLSLDVDSWTWSFSFSVNGSALPTVERNASGDPVVAQANINGTLINFILEQISRERSFGSNQLRVQGRGMSAQLDAPYAPTLYFGNANARTAQQLLADILTVNGESIGWDVPTFEPLDWLVPAGVFSHTGSYISAMNAVVNSVGAYLQPYDTADSMAVRMRYPTPSWEWAGATPDLILPSAVTSTESVEWVNKPDYTRVYVGGQEGGVAGRYTRAGTAGDLLAPGVVDPLITAAEAVRQRGRTILSETGTMASVTLRLPVLTETGIIRPGTMVRYTDSGEVRIGMSRSVAVDIGMPTIYQTIMVETYV